MKTFTIVTFLFCLSHVQAQIQQSNEPAQGYSVDEKGNLYFAGKPLVITGGGGEKPEPIKCGQYQHLYHQDAYTGGGPCSNGFCASIAIYHPEVNECMDDMHEITERDWQGLMDRLKALEGK